MHVCMLAPTSVVSGKSSIPGPTRKKACHNEFYKVISKIQILLVHPTQQRASVKLLEPGPSVQSGLEDGQQPPSPSSSSVMETGHFTKIKALGRESTVNTRMKQADLVGKGKREGREGKEGEGKQCISISEGQEGPTQQEGVIWMEGAYSLKLAEEEEKLVARTSTIPPCLSDPHHLNTEQQSP